MTRATPPAPPTTLTTPTTPTPLLAPARPRRVRPAALAMAAVAGLLVVVACSPAGSGRADRRAPAAGVDVAAPGAVPASSAAEPAQAGRTAEPGLARIEATQLRESALGLLQKAALDGTPEERANAIEALIPVGTRLEPAARAGLADANPAVRSVATLAVARARLTRLAAPVQALLNDPSPQVRAGAILALARCGLAPEPGPLAGMLRDESPMVRAQAAFVLGELGNTSAVGLLREAARDPMSRADPAPARLARLQIAEALVKLGHEDAIHEIRSALYPARPEELEATVLAVQILGEVRDLGSRSQLVRLGTVRDETGAEAPAEVQIAVDAAMAKMGDAGAGWVAERFRTAPQAPLRAQAALALGATRNRAKLGSLAGMLSDPDPLVRIAAAGAVLRITDGLPRTR